VTASFALSFDAEEFDLPRERGIAISVGEELRLGASGWERTLALLDRLGLRATFFATARIAQHAPEFARHCAQRHELASHGMAHTGWTDDDARTSRLELERLTGAAVLGFRRPRLAPTPPSLLVQAGYLYDASVHPTWIPGRYCMLGARRTPARHGAAPTLAEVPASVTPTLHLPLFWLTMKNLPWPIYRRCLARVMARDGHVTLYAHPWELADLGAIALPRWIKGRSPAAVEARWAQVFAFLSDQGESVTCLEVARRVLAQHS
jgi:peptidoglycan/xylan/chitin deacetylase (PgdA/CDA1 family)